MRAGHPATTLRCRRPSLTQAVPCRFYYHSETRETQWEEPAGVGIEHSIDPRAAEATHSQPASGQKRQLSATDGSAILMTLTSFAVPIGLFFLVLMYLYMKADKEGLQDVLRNLKQKRDRSAKRKGDPAATRLASPRLRVHNDGSLPPPSPPGAGSKAGSSFRHKFKLSQDGKGGRSANS